MKKLAATLLTLLHAVTHASHGADAPIDHGRLVACWKAVENWHRPTVGKEGELGPFQIKPATWREHSDKPISWAYGSSDLARAEQDATALRIVKWCERQVGPLNLKPGVESIALVWKAGFGNLQRKPVRAVDRDYAARVANLYRDREFAP